MKQNIFCKKDKFIPLLKLEINKVETFFLEKREVMHNIDNFCLLNLFSILKITKKYHKKNNQDISDIVYNLYFRKSFYLYLVSDLNINQGDLLRGFQKCSLCYDRTIYILQNRENISQELFCKRCSASTNKIFSYSLDSSSDDKLSLDSSSLVVLQSNDVFRILNRFIEIEDL